MRVVCLVLLVASTAHASPAAEKLFQDGRTLLKQGKLAEACDAFRASNDLEPRAGTLLNLADCEERRDRIATAWATFIEARTLANQKADKIKSAEAEKRAAALAKKLPYLTVRVPASRPAGFAVTRDGKHVPAAELDREVPIDPGSYEIEATAEGHAAWKQPVTVAVGQKAVVEIPALEATPTTTTPTTTLATPTTTATTTAAPPIVDVPPVPRESAAKTRFGLGASVGAGTDGGPSFGARAIARLGAAGPGSLRVVGTGLYWMLGDRDGQGQNLRIYGFGLGAEYLHTLAPKLRIAVGADVGLIWAASDYTNFDARTEWIGGRVSPSYRVVDGLDLTLHVKTIYSEDSTVLLGEVGVEYFVW